MPRYFVIQPSMSTSNPLSLPVLGSRKVNGVTWLLVLTFRPCVWARASEPSPIFAGPNGANCCAQLAGRGSAQFVTCVFCAPAGLPPDACAEAPEDGPPPESLPPQPATATASAASAASTIPAPERAWMGGRRR